IAALIVGPKNSQNQAATSRNHAPFGLGLSVTLVGIMRVGSGHRPESLDEHQKQVQAEYHSPAIARIRPSIVPAITTIAPSVAPTITPRLSPTPASTPSTMNGPDKRRGGRRGVGSGMR